MINMIEIIILTTFCHLRLYTQSPIIRNGHIRPGPAFLEKFKVANPLLESFGESPMACMTNTSKEKETKICHWFVQTIGLVTWHSLR